MKPILPLLAVPCLVLAGEPIPWSSESYPDEAGYQQRIDGMIGRIAGLEYLRRAMSPSTCPDTGLPVYTWAVEGEEIVSPYTGRRYVQGPTGYFGAKRRDDLGRISHFGGDPLKQSLPPATAILLLARQNGEDFNRAISPLDPDVANLLQPGVRASRAQVARAYLSIPGNLRQHYHFACVNWARFLPLLGDAMTPEWHADFRAAVAVYTEDRRPSDGVVREYQPLPRTETLIGVDEEHLGGGGTENHKTMWRASGLLYAQLLPEGSLVSAVPREEAIRRTSAMLTRYVRGLCTVGSGEYDSSTYYPYSIRAFLNLHDFSPDPEVRAWARVALDYYVATYGLKVLNGVMTGPQRRGWVDGWQLGEMDRHLHAWVPRTTVPVDYGRFITTLHQATSSYRPNRVMFNLIAKQVALPFEAEIAHPDYGMTRRNAQPEYFYASESFAMGSVQMDLVNNSAQQTTWSLNVRGPNGSLIFGGGQPRWLHPEGHSPYDQWVQKRGTLLLMTDATAPKPGEPEPAPYRHGVLEGPRGYTRQAAFSGPLEPVSPPPQGDLEALRKWWESARTGAVTFLFVPRDAGATIHEERPRQSILVESSETWVRITPFNDRWFWVGPEDPSQLGSLSERDPLALLRHYRVLATPGLPSGFAIDAVERSAFPQRPSLSGSTLRVDEHGATYRSLAGDMLRLDYQPSELRPRATVNSRALDWSTWASGGVYESPYLRIKDGRMWVSDGREAYEMTYAGAAPEWRHAPPRP